MVEGLPSPENMWERLSSEKQKTLLESWKKRAEELKQKLGEIEAKNDSERKRIVSALDAAIRELASLIEGRALESNIELSGPEKRTRWVLARTTLLQAIKDATALLDEEPEKASEYSALRAEIRRFEIAVQSAVNAPNAE